MLRRQGPREQLPPEGDLSLYIIGVLNVTITSDIIMEPITRCRPQLDQPHLRQGRG